MEKNERQRTTFTLGTKQDALSGLVPAAFSAPVLLQKRSEPALDAPSVFDADGVSATVKRAAARAFRAPSRAPTTPRRRRWSGGSPPFSLQYALADDEAALGINGGGPWVLAAARINGHVAKKKNLKSGKRYSWRVKMSDAPNCAWSRASDEYQMPVPSPFMPRAFGEFLADKGGAQRPTGVALAGRIVAVLASASWCDASKALESQLLEVYATLRAAGKPFETVWLSEENCDADHAKHLASRPWLSVPYHRCEREQALEHFHISSIPRLMILSPAGKILADNTTPADVTAGFDGWLAAAKSGSG